MYSVTLVTQNKRAYLPMLEMADESLRMIDSYLDRGALYVLNENGVDLCAAVVTMEDGGVCELQNIAVLPQYRFQGYGTLMVETLCFKYAASFQVMRVGTGGKTVAFYEKNGFTPMETIPGYFLEHYDTPILEDGVQIIDRVVLSRPIVQGCKCCGKA